MAGDPRVAHRTDSSAARGIIGSRTCRSSDRAIEPSTAVNRTIARLDDHPFDTFSISSAFLHDFSRLRRYRNRVMQQQTMTREEAQRRANRIRAFNEEAAALERDGILRLTPDARAAIRAYHDGLLAELARQFDVDRTDAQHQLSLGMRIVSLLGALALTAAVVLLFLRIWGFIPTAAQVAVVSVAPIVLVVAASVAARLERTLYFTYLLAILAFACFILDVSVVGAIFNARPSAQPFLVWGAFALALAYTWELRILLAIGTAMVVGWSAASWVSVWGHPFDLALERPETLILPALAVTWWSGAAVNRRRGGFPQALRLVGLAIVFVAVLVLGEEGQLSYVRADRIAIEHSYQLIGFVVAGVAIGYGIRRRWTETMNAGAIFFGILLFLRYVDWFWNWMPKYAFFLVVGATAVAFMVVLRRLRNRSLIAGATS
jgi:uncharacterized membrane protein